MPSENIWHAARHMLWIRDICIYKIMVKEKPFEDLWLCHLILDVSEKQLRITWKTAADELSQCAVAQFNFPLQQPLLPVPLHCSLSLSLVDKPPPPPRHDLPPPCCWHWANWHWLMPDPSRARRFSLPPWSCGRSWRHVWVNVLLWTFAKLFVWFLRFFINNSLGSWAV